MNISKVMRTLRIVLAICTTGLCGQNAKPDFLTTRGYVQASGRWRNTSGKPEDNLGKHSARIECRLDIKECSEVFAQQVTGADPQVSVQHYRVIQWTKNDIIAEDNAPICVTNRLLINFQEQSVTAMDTPKKGAKGLPLDNGGTACDWYNRTVTYRLVR